MNHSSYKIFITKSSEAARLISAGLDVKKEESYISMSCGAVNQDSRIPALYHDCGYFFAMVEYKNGEDWDKQKYELTIC